jgi:hypothetical protein
MSASKYYYCEIVLYNEQQYFISVHLKEDSSGFVFKYYTGISGFFDQISIKTEQYEKSVLSVVILPCKKVLLAIVECYDVPSKKFVKYQVQGHDHIIEVDPDVKHDQLQLRENIVNQTLNQVYVVSTPGQTITCAEIPKSFMPEFWCGTCKDEYFKHQ